MKDHYLCPNYFELNQPLRPRPLSHTNAAPHIRTYISHRVPVLWQLERGSVKWHIVHQRNLLKLPHYGKTSPIIKTIWPFPRTLFCGFLCPSWHKPPSPHRDNVVCDVWTARCLYPFGVLPCFLTAMQHSGGPLTLRNDRDGSCSFLPSPPIAHCILN